MNNKLEKLIQEDQELTKLNKLIEQEKLDKEDLEKEENYEFLEEIFNNMFEANSGCLQGWDITEFERIEGALHVFPFGKKGHSLEGCCCKPMQYFRQGTRQALIIHFN